MGFLVHASFCSLSTLLIKPCTIPFNHQTTLNHLHGSNYLPGRYQLETTVNSMVELTTEVSIHRAENHEYKQRHSNYYHSEQLLTSNKNSRGPFVPIPKDPENRNSNLRHQVTHTSIAPEHEYITQELQWSHYTPLV